MAVATSGRPISVMSVGASGPTSIVAETSTTASGGSSTTTSTSVATSTTTTAPATATTVEAKAPPPPTTVPDAAAIEAAAQRFCSLSTTYVEQVRLIEISLSSPARVRELVEAAAPAAAESVTIASKELRTDTATVSGALDQLRTALKAADYQMGKLSPDMVMKLQSPPVQDALNRVEAFTGKAC